MGTRLPLIFGSLTLIGSIMQLIAMTIEEDGLPHDTSTWFNFATKVTIGIGLIVSKQFNVSNAPQPAVATVLPKSS